ncbi:alpha/beta hydrolase [Piscinibacter terrae]|nr:alpha/beta fold hydrolase [Albitalea terrae]
MTMRSLYFGQTGREALAWLHDAEQPAQRGLVICSSFGREDLCIHRSLKHIAQAAAAQGMPALRFDYPGSGDSAGAEFGDGVVGRWIASIGDAIDTLKQETGVTEVCLLGVRLGTLLAACAATGRDDVAGMVAIAPLIAGRFYVRELKAYALGAASMGMTVPQERGDHLLQAGGFAMDDTTQEALKAVDLLKDDWKPPYPALIIERDDVPPDPRWLQHLQGVGSQVSSLRIPGFAGMVRDSSPHHCEVPSMIIDAVMPWMMERLPLSGSAHVKSVPVASAMRWTSPQGVELVEQVETVDVGARLTALVTRPASAAVDSAPQRAIVLLSGGADRRIGPGRLFVRFAREWAARGFIVLRLDLSGIGDSEPRPGMAENLPYMRHALDDIAAAVQHLRREHRVGHCQLVGHCAGAYNAFRAAVETTVVDSVVLINPLLYLSVGDGPVDLTVQRTEVNDSVRGYKRSLFHWDRWRALLADPGKVLRVGRILAELVRGKLSNRVRDLMRLLGVHLKDDLPSELLKLARRNTQVRLVFSDDEHGESLLWSLGGATVKRLRRKGRLSIDHARGADHLFTLQSDREALVKQLAGLIEPVQATSSPSPVAHRAMSPSKGMA